MNEDELEMRLRELTTDSDGPPDSVLEAARAALSLRDLDAELAALVADSASDAVGVLTRTVTSDVRMLSFECGEVSIELDVESDPVSRSLRLRGIVVGATGEIVLVRATSRISAQLDADGRFDSPDIPSGPLRLELETPQGHRITTSWVSV